MLEIYFATTSIACVLKAGDNFKMGEEETSRIPVKKGDYIRLRDWKSQVIIDPMFKGFNEMRENRGSMTKTSDAGSKHKFMLHEQYARDIYFIDPLKVKDYYDYFIFMVPYPEIQGIIEPQAYIEDGVDH